jgi:hypothetical protein
MLESSEQFLGAVAKLRKTTVGFVMFVHPFICLSAWNSSPPTGQIFKQGDVCGIFENLSRKFNFIGIGQECRVRYMNTNIHFFVIYYLFLLRMIKVSDKGYRGILNTCFVFSNFFLKHAVYDIIWKNIVQWDRP